MSEKYKAIAAGKTFSKNDLERIRHSEEEQENFRRRLKSNGNLTRQEEAALKIDNYDAFSVFWQDTLGTKAAFNTDRTRGAGKAGKKVTSFMASADDMIKDFNPIVEVVRDFGSPYGALAVGTVCFLFTVAKNRSKMEEDINTTLLEIRDRLPGVKMYGYIYGADNELEHMMQSKIVDAYESFISFCIAAAEFYTQRAWRRWLMAIGGNGHLDIRVSDVQKAVVAVRTAGEELVTRNVHDIKMQNEDLRRKIQELQDSQDNKNLDEIRRQLELEPFSLDKQREKLARYRRDITAEFDDSDFSDKTYAERLQVVENDAAFQDWLRHPKSRLLVLSGRNYVHEATNCWVSPIALDVIAKFTTTHAQGQDASIDDVCAFHVSTPRDGRYTFPGVVTALVYQLLLASKRSLRSVENETFLRADLEQYLDIQKRGGAVSATREPLQRLMLTVLGFFAAEKRTVWIILDRVDRGSDYVGESGMRQRNVHRQTLLHLMADLVRETDATVKVLAVVNTVDWDVEEKEDFGQSEEGSESVIVRTISEDDAG
ncbi:hypothetical protein Daus18300_011255 [Diaporthe australafricana]|uniref:DUF7708 domain-containing protein n=1 Tax=Diaporthe australafricana TaxID=127596 RepID=A0ABR3W779_9PEZI